MVVLVLLLMLAMIIVVMALRILARWILPKDVADGLFRAFGSVVQFIANLLIVAMGVGLIAFAVYVYRVAHA